MTCVLNWCKKKKKDLVTCVLNWCKKKKKKKKAICNSSRGDPVPLTGRFQNPRTNYPYHRRDHHLHHLHHRQHHRHQQQQQHICVIRPEVMLCGLTRLFQNPRTNYLYHWCDHHHHHCYQYHHHHDVCYHSSRHTGGYHSICFCTTLVILQSQQMSFSYKLLQ